MSHKIQWIISIILCVVGLLIMMLSFMIVNFDLEKYVKGSKYMEKKYEIAGSKIQRIRIKEIDKRIEIRQSLDDQIHIVYNENKKNKLEYTINQNGNELIFERKFKLIWQLNPFHFLTDKDTAVVLELPKGYLYDVEASTVSGRIEVNSDSLKSSILSTTSGKIENHKNSSEEIKMNSVSGKIVSSMSEAPNGFTASTVSGSIRFEGIKSNNVTLNSVSGSIKGNVIGKEEDYSIQTSSVSGSRNVENRTGKTDKKIKASTTSGSIRIYFAE